MHDNNDINEISDSYKQGDFVEGTVIRVSKIGVHVKIDDFTTGLIHQNEIYQDMRVGNKLKVYIKKVREDGKLDLSLTKGGYKNFIEDTTSKLLALLKENNGFLPYNDKTSPYTIQEELNMSKKKFKEAVGALYKTRKIVITPSGIELYKNTNQKPLYKK